MIEMVIDSIRVSLMNYQRVVILKEKIADRYLPIWIGPAEADAIAVKLQGVNVPRPLTHDLLQDVIGKLGANVNSILVSDLAQGMGLGKEMLRRMLDIARQEKLARIEALVTPDNEAMKHICGELGFRLVPVSEENLIKAEIDL